MTQSGAHILCARDFRKKPQAHKTVTVNRVFDEIYKNIVKSIPTLTQPVRLNRFR